MRLWGSLASILIVTFAAFSASSTYQLKSYSVGPGGTTGSTSTTYEAQDTVGDQANGSASSTTYTNGSGSIQTEQLNVPGAPTLSNNSNTYYNMLNVIISTSNNPSDTTYAIAVSTTSNFATTYYVQSSNGSLGGSPDYETYSTWGSSGGSSITGLTASTTYYAKVAAKEGLFTNTEYGAVASQTTANPSITFSVSPSSSSLGTFLPNTIATSSSLSFTFATNAVSGGNVYVSGLHGGFYSAAYSYNILAVTGSGNLGGLSQGFGVQGASSNLTVDAPYNGTGNTVGNESSTPAPIFSTAAAIVGGTASANVQVKSLLTAPPSNDYTEVLTFVASASF